MFDSTQFYSTVSNFYIVITKILLLPGFTALLFEKKMKYMHTSQFKRYA